MAVVATGQLALADLNDAVISGVEPTSKHPGMLWIDESKNPPMLKKWTGEAWVDVGELDPNLSVIIDNIESTLGNMANDNVINFAERQIIKDKITEITGTVIADATTTMPTAATLDAGNKGNFWSVRKSALNAGLTTSTTEYSTLTTRYNELKSYLDGLTPIKPWDLRSGNKDIAISVVKDTFRSRWLNYYIAVDALATKTAEKLKQNVDDVEIGAVNLVRNGNFATGDLSKWINNGSVTYQLIDGRKTAYLNISSGLYQMNISKESGIYSYSFMAKALDNTTSARIGFLNAGVGASDNFLLTTSWARYTFTTKVPVDAGQVFHVYSDGKRYYITDIKVEKGTKATGWTSNPEDDAEKILDIEGKITNVQQKITDDAIVNTVTSSEKWVKQMNVIDGNINGVKEYVKSRGENLVTNGTGLLGNNTNFSQFTFDGSQVFAGGGSFYSDTQNGTRVSDELIPVDPSRKYRFSLMAKSKTGLGHNYFGVVSYDIDGYQISPYHFYGSQYPITTLARDLKSGDTEIYLTSSVGFMDNSATPDHRHSIIFWGYKNSFGYEYPEGTYSRLIATTAWDVGAINRTTHVITLNSPFNLKNPNDPSGVFKAGYKVSPTSSGGSYQYNVAQNVKVSKDNFENFRGNITGIGISANSFPHGTAFIKLLFLLNRNTSGGTAGDSIWVNNLEFTDVTDIDKAQKDIIDANNQIDNIKDLIKVRYIRDWLNGSTANLGNHWVEIQAINDKGTNIALRKNVTASSASITNLPLVTDGDYTTGQHAAGGSGRNWVQVDLGQVYDNIDYINVWHYYGDGRTYNDTKTEVSADGINWTVLFDSAKDGKYAESADGNSLVVNLDVARNLGDVGRNISLIKTQINNVEQTITSEGISTVIAESTFYEDLMSKLEGKANTESLGDLATKGELNDLSGDIDSRIDGAIKGIDFEPYATRLELEETSKNITAKFSATGGMNLIKNSIGFGGKDFWVDSPNVESIQNNELDMLGFGSGFYAKYSTAGANIYQEIPVVPGQKYTLSWYQNFLSTDASGYEIIIVYDGDVASNVRLLNRTTKVLTDGYEYRTATFTPTKNTINLRIGSYLAEIIFTGLMLTIGDIPLQWSLATGESYNTNVRMDIKGIRVSQLDSDRNEIGYTQISPDEFAGYYITDDGSFDKVFYLNGEETVTKKLKAIDEITMGQIKIINIQSPTKRGWAFVPVTDD